MLDHHSSDDDFRDELDPLDKAAWRTESASENDGACVQLAVLRQKTGVRDSKLPSAGRLVVPDAGRAGLVAFARSH